MVTPKLSTTLLTFSADDPGGWGHLVEQARAADEAGLDRLALPDHVVFGENLDAYGDPKAGGTIGGKQPTGPDGHWLEPLATIAHLSAVTTNVRFITGILIAALRRPAVLAKSAATIDVLSGGRLDLGVGVGWQREEYEAVGLDYSERGAMLDHTLEVCQTLWRESSAEHESPHLSFSGIHQMPKPTSETGVPIWVSGTANPRAMSRLARFGTGWIPWGPDAADLGQGIDKMRTALTDLGRDPEGVEVVANLAVVTNGDGTIDPDATMDRVPDLVARGATDFRLGMRLPRSGVDAQERLMSLVETFRSATERDQP